MEKLVPNKTYHIFNHANGFEKIFTEDENYRFFLDKYKQYITPIAETYAYCLLPNHFHLVVRIRRKDVIEELIRNKNNFSKVSFDFGKVREEVNISNDDIEKYLSKKLSNFFSCYTQSFNRMYKRMGSLFIKNFRREVILDKEYFMNAVVYTHRNPVHHGFCKHYNDWSYTSYCEISERKSKVVDVNKLLAVFKSKEFFIDFHQQNLDKFNQSTELEAP